MRWTMRARYTATIDAQRRLQEQIELDRVTRATLLAGCLTVRALRGGRTRPVSRRRDVDSPG
jgi:hypothetical protein